MTKIGAQNRMWCSSAAVTRKLARWFARCVNRGAGEILFRRLHCQRRDGDGSGRPQYTNGIYMTFGKDPRLIPDGKAVIDKFRAGKFEPEGYTLSYASVQAIAAAFRPPAARIPRKPASG